jgi:N5-(carboxyethyl)ornithine synthase
MKTVGFPISSKENENRRALIPASLKSIKHKNCIFVEQNYGNVLGYTDEEYISAGCFVGSRDEVLKKDIICDPKIGDAEYLDILSPGTIIFGWIHAIQNRDITNKLITNKLTGIAWEDMHHMGRHIFWQNNELAGVAAIMHALPIYGLLATEAKVAVIGKGNIAKGALTILNRLGAEVIVYDRKTEQLFRNEMDKYDIIVNALLWDIKRKDHIIYREDLSKLKKGAFIIDISCDRNGAIETCIPTTIEKPTYYVDNILHYAVDHTPSLFHKSVSTILSSIVASYIDYIIIDELDDILSNAINIKEGIILDKRIKKFQKRQN